MSGWLAGIFLAWRLWVWLLPRLDVSAAGLYLQDLLGRLQAGGHLGTWDLPAAPCLFPDLGLAWFCQTQRADPLAAQRAYGLLLGLLAWASLAWLLRSLWGLSRAKSRVYAAMGMLLVLALSGPGLDSWLFPAQHGVAWVAALGLWAWTLDQKERPDGWLGTFIWAAMAGALAASDPWFALWALPALLLLALRARPKVWPTEGTGQTHLQQFGSWSLMAFPFLILSRRRKRSSTPLKYFLRGPIFAALPQRLPDAMCIQGLILQGMGPA